MIAKARSLYKIVAEQALHNVGCEEESSNVLIFGQCSSKLNVPHKNMTYDLKLQHFHIDHNEQLFNSQRRSTSLQLYTCIPDILKALALI